MKNGLTPKRYFVHIRALALLYQKNTDKCTDILLTQHFINNMYEDRIPVGARFSAPVQNGLGAHPASCTIGTASFPGGKSGRRVTLTSHPILVPCSRKSRVITLLPLWAVRPVQSLSACTREHFIFFYLTMYVTRTCFNQF